MKSANRITVRVEMHPDGHGRMDSIYGELDADIPPTPGLIAERVALLKICDVSKKLDGVGKRQSRSIYYVHLTEAEARQVSEEIKRARCNAVDG